MRYLILFSTVVTVFLAGGRVSAEPDTSSDKTASVFYPPDRVRVARAAADTRSWVGEVRESLVAAAEPWMKMSDDELWGLMFGATIKRSWMVWSNGHCPACDKDVPMYNWEVHALERPWKMRCPHCQELFPKNDFEKFHRSGLDEHGVFDPARADRSLLFNVEHPEPADPLHKFGVDDGDGYVDGDKRWRFIGAYLIYGQWKQAVVAGARNLAAAYVMTGERAYAHKTAILLDRVADLHPTFDFKEQAILYEGPGAAGYVSTWHDACVEVRELTLAYDRVFDALSDDAELVRFLAGKATEYKLDNPKRSFADIQRNIEERILLDTLKNDHKIRSNYPQTDITKAMILLTLDTPETREQAAGIIEAMLDKATAVDGVTGEKGMAGYTAMGPQAVAPFIGEITCLEPQRLKEVLQRHPRLRDMYRFFIDTWHQGQYYPLIGDTGYFAQRVQRYHGLLFQKPGQAQASLFSGSLLAPSMFTFTYLLHKLTGDPAFAQVLYHANGGSVEGLPHDLFWADEATVQREVAEVITREGPTPQSGSVNKTQWHLAILRGGTGDRQHAVWLDYDSGGGHSHRDGMNLGLFARGLDLMPEFGYPPVQYGGWSSPRALWYTMTAAHNTVVVDGVNQRAADGVTTLWADGRQFRAMRAAGGEMYGISRYERTAVAVDVADNDFYVLDVFRVAGGKDHARFMHSHFAEVSTNGLTLSELPDFGNSTLMRNFRGDAAPKSGWHVDFKVDDRNKYLEGNPDIHLRYTDLTTGAQAALCEAWVVAGIFNSTQEVWIPRVMVRRQGEAPLTSTFVGMIEPYEGKPIIAATRRLGLQSEGGGDLPDSHVAVEVQLADGRRDVIIATDPQAGPPSIAQGSTEGTGDFVVRDVTPTVRFKGDLGLVRLDQTGSVERLALYGATTVMVGDLIVKLRADAGFVELQFDKDTPTLVSGQTTDIESIRVSGRPVWP